MNERNRPTIQELEAILGAPNASAVEITPSGEVVVKGLRHEIELAVNRVSAENGSNTPDFILAEYLVSCLAAFDRAVTNRERWHGRAPTLSGPVITDRAQGVDCYLCEDGLPHQHALVSQKGK